MVVLGVGAGSACADQLAQQALGALSARTPLDALAAALDAARRWRWPDASATLSATLRSSTGEFGGVQAAPPSGFGAALLRRAVERRAVLGGPRPSWPQASSDAPPDAACEAGPEPSLAGPIGVLLRAREGEFWGGVVNADPLADAGVVSLAAQYGVSLAVGRRGAVLLIGDCDPPPLERSAARVYDSANWVRATAGLQAPGGCSLGHALLSAERAWVASSGDVAWGAVEAAPAPASPPPAPPPPARSSDAGLADPPVTP